MVIVVASKNPAKIEAVKLALKNDFANAEVVSIEVDSLVSSQPFTDEETKQGSINRAKNALDKTPNATLAVGLEGGAFREGKDVWNTVWCSVVDREGNVFSVNGMRFVLPTVISEKMNEGTELGYVMDQISGKTNTKHDEGMIGIVSNGYVKRAEAYADLVKLALGLWNGRKWEKNIKMLDFSRKVIE